MLLPSPLQIFPRRLDPSGGRLDFYPTLSRGADPLAMLDDDEDVVSFTVEVSLIGWTAGMRVIDAAERAPRYADLTFGFWAEIDPSMRASSIFDGDGVLLGIEVSFVTDAGRSDQFTVYVRVVNK